MYLKLNLGALAGGVSGAAIVTHTGLGGAALASCPNLALSTITGTGGAILGSPLMPFGALILGEKDMGLTV